MIKRRITKRAAVLGGIGTLVAGGAIAAAVVLLTASGTGSGIIIAGSGNGGSAGGGTGPVTLSVDALGVTGGFNPGGTADTVNLDVTNGNANPVLVTTVSYGGVSSPNAACQAVIAASPSQFVQLPNSVTENTTVPAVTSNFALPNPVVLKWIDVPGLDQSPCQGQALVLTENTP